jgi:integrase
VPRRIEPSVPAGGSLVRRPDSASWYVQWCDPDAKRLRRWSTGATDRAAAEAAWERVAAKPEASDAPRTPSPGFVSVAAVLDHDFETHARKIVSAEQARIAIRHLKACHKDRRVADLVDEVVQQDYLDWRAKGGAAPGARPAPARARARSGYAVAPSTINREVSVLRAAIRLYADRHEGAPRPRIDDVDLPDRDARWLRTDEVARLFQGAESLHIGLFILLMVATAGRPEAVRDLTRDRIDWSGEFIRLNRDDRPQTAKRRPRIRIDERLMALLRAAAAVRTSVHVIEYGGWAVGSVKKGFAAAAARAGFGPGEVAPYTRRHTAATWMAQAGVPLRDIAGYLGHRDTRMVERVYAHHHPDHQERPRAAITEGLARAGAFGPRLAAKIAARDPAALSERRQNVAKKLLWKGRKRPRGPITR